MKGFLLGLLVAALLVAGYLYWQSRAVKAPAPVAVAVKTDAGVPRKKRVRHGRGAARIARVHSEASALDRLPGEQPSEGEPEHEPIKLSPADLRSVGQGDDLGRPDVVHLDMSDDQQLPE